MKLAKLTQKISLVLACGFIFALGIFAQENPSQKRDRVAKAETPNTKTDTANNNTSSDASVKASSNDSKQPQPSETPAVQDDKKNDGTSQTRQENLSEEEAAILPYYNNYLREYHIGPEDVISVDVFGEPNYSKQNMTVPPNAKISYPLIGGVFVGGKTTDQIEQEISKKLEEYIIEPKVTVILEKVGSAQFSVLGKVGTPGVRLMTRRYNVYEAVVEAGGVAKDGDRKRVILIRRSPQGGYTQTLINFDTLLSGKTEIPYLAPGDQIIVPEKKWNINKIFDAVGKASAFRILFGSPF